MEKELPEGMEEDMPLSEEDTKTEALIKSMKDKLARLEKRLVTK